MIFNSLPFILFFIITVLIYWWTGPKKRWIFLIIASLVFYGVNIPEYLIVLLASVIVNYLFGLWIGGTFNPESRKRLLTAGIILNVLMLALFKYSNEIIALNLPIFPPESTIFSFLPHDLIFHGSNFNRIIMPLGISFFTFTNLAYLIDVKRGTVEPERHLGYFTVYITFFPKLIQGPVERTNHFMPQIKNPRNFNFDLAVDGLRLMLWGFFKKLIIADRLIVAVDYVFDNPSDHNGPVLVFAAILYSFQIYMDFSAYMDIARGAAKVLGFDLLRNFYLPYFSRSIKEFWERWHMTLSSWLRDYLFLPLAFMFSRILKEDKYLGIRTDKIIYSFAASITFLIAGLWHGTGWTFIFWGGLFGFYLIVENFMPRSFYYKQKVKYSFSGFLRILGIFSLVTFSWIFFRSDSLRSAFGFLSGIPFGWDSVTSPDALLQQLIFPGFTQQDLTIVLFTIPLVEITEYHIYFQKLLSPFRHPPRFVSWGFYYAILLLLFAYGIFENQAFIYFQF